MNISKSSVVLEDLETIYKEVRDISESLEGSTIVISGANGFIGKYLVNTLLYLNKFTFKNPCTIIAVDKNIGIDFIDSNNLNFLVQDISKDFKFEGNVDYVIHAASIASPVVYRKYPLQTIDVNVLGTKNLLEFAKSKNVKSFLYFSSSEVYGNPDAENIPTKEDYIGRVSFTGPRACYDESKRLAETLCMIYFKEFNLPVKIVRPFNVYGPGLKPDDGRVIPDFLKYAITNNEIVLFSDGSPTRSFCYISDAVAGFFRVLLSKHTSEAFNVGNDEEISMLNLANLIVKKFSTNVKIRFETHADINYTTDNPQRRCPDLTKIKTMVDYRTNILLEKGLDRMINWYKSILKNN